MLISILVNLKMMNSEKQMMMSVVSKPMLKHKWANKKRGLRESFITYKMKMRQGRGSRGDSIIHIKEAASHQIEVVTEATASLGRGLKKSICTYKKEAGRFAISLGEFVDVEDILKSIHQVAHPEEHAKRKTSIVHTPIDWSKRTVPTLQTFSEKCPTIFEHEEEEGIDGEDVGRKDNEKNAREESVRRFSEPARKVKKQHRTYMPSISVSAMQMDIDEQEPVRRFSEPAKKVNIQHPISMPTISVSPIQTEIDNQRSSRARLLTSSLSLAQNTHDEQKVPLKSRRRKSTSSLGIQQKDFEEQEIMSSNKRLSSSSLTLPQNALEEQKGHSSRRRLSTSSLGLPQNDCGDQDVISDSKRLSALSISCPQKNFVTNEILTSSKIQSTSSLGLHQKNYNEEKLLTSNRPLSKPIVHQVSHTHTPTAKNTSTRIRRSSAPHIFQVHEDGRFSSSRPSRNQSQMDHINSTYNREPNSPRESHLWLHSRRQSCRNNPGVEQDHSSTKGRRRSSCFLKLDTTNTNSAFRCKSPIIKKKPSNVGLDFT